MKEKFVYFLLDILEIITWNHEISFYKFEKSV